jgi:6-phosphogluconolactonase
VSANGVALWLGCYTSDMSGRGDGILALTRTADGEYEPLGPATPVASPSFLALHPSQPVLYAVSEGAQLLHAYGIDDAGALTPLGTAGATGELVCHVAVDPDGAFVLVSCWGDGAVIVFELEPDGSLGERHLAPASVDPHAEDRQSRAHSCLMLGDGRMVTTDLGHDVLRFWSFSTLGGLEPQGTLELPEGSGPRHFARSAAGNVYVDTEHSIEVAVLAANGAATGPSLSLRGIYPASAHGARPGDAAAEICLDASERTLYVGVRGSDVICRLALDAEGVPSPLDEIACPGTWPRHQCVCGDELLVALERSDAVARIPLAPDGRTGEPRLIAAGSPTCVLPHRLS